MKRFTSLLCASMYVPLVACHGSASFHSQVPDESNAFSGDGAGADFDAPGNSPQVPVPNGAVSDVPCDVLHALARNCQSCHANPPTGAPFPLMQRGDFTRESPTFPGQTIAQRAGLRLNDAIAPMPPTALPRPTTAEQSTMAAWFSAGAPAGAGCAPGTQAPSPPVIQVICSSNQFWDPDEDEGNRMNPGLACITCHRRDDGPDFRIGGTVYPTLYERDRCFGIPGGGRVEITDANGAMFTANIGSTGNFNISGGAVVFPIRPRVVSSDGRARAMTMPAPHGNCNECHTERGANGAPGRVMFPAP
jgi:hypothetical protein